MKTVKIEERGERQWKKTGMGGHAEKRDAEELYHRRNYCCSRYTSDGGEEEYNGELRKGENEEGKRERKKMRRMEMGDSTHIREKEKKEGRSAAGGRV